MYPKQVVPSALLVGDTTVNGTIGALTAQQSVDQYRAFVLTQHTPGIHATLPNPTSTTPGLVVAVAASASSDQALTMYGVTLDVGAGLTFLWDGAKWTVTGAGDAFVNGGNATGSFMLLATNDDNNLLVRAGNPSGAIGNLILAGQGSVNITGNNGNPDVTITSAGSSGNGVVITSINSDVAVSAATEVSVSADVSFDVVAGAQSSKLSSTSVTTTDGTLTQLAFFPLIAGKTTRGRFIVQGNIIGDGTNPNPAPASFYRECATVIPWPGAVSSGATSASDAGLSFVKDPFVDGTAPFHTPTDYSVMLSNDGTNLVVSVQGYGGVLPDWTLGNAYTAGTIVIGTGGNLYICVAGVPSATTEPSGTGNNIADGLGAWSYVQPGGTGLTIQWTLCSYELFVG